MPFFRITVDWDGWRDAFRPPPDTILLRIHNASEYEVDWSDRKTPSESREHSYETITAHASDIPIEVPEIIYLRRKASTEKPVVVFYYSSKVPIGELLSIQGMYSPAGISRYTLSGLSATVSGVTVVSEVSGNVVIVSGQPVSTSGQVANIANQAVKVSGEVLDISDRPARNLGIAKVSGEVLDISDRDGRALGIAKVSGEVLDISDRVGRALGVAKVSGEVLDISDRVGRALGIAKVSGEVLDISDRVGRALGIAKVSGEVLDISDRVGRALGIAKVSGEVLDISDRPARSLGIAKVSGEVVQISGQSAVTVTPMFGKISGGAVVLPGDSYTNTLIVSTGISRKFIELRALSGEAYLAGTSGIGIASAPIFLRVGDAWNSDKYSGDIWGITTAALSGVTDVRWYVIQE